MKIACFGTNTAISISSKIYMNLFIKINKIHNINHKNIKMALWTIDVLFDRKKARFWPKITIKWFIDVSNQLFLSVRKGDTNQMYLTFK